MFSINTGWTFKLLNFHSPGIFSNCQKRSLFPKYDCSRYSLNKGHFMDLPSQCWLHLSILETAACWLEVPKRNRWWWEPARLMFTSTKWASISLSSHHRLFFPNILTESIWRKTPNDLYKDLISERHEKKKYATVELFEKKPASSISLRQKGCRARYHQRF